jgi:hypothetical protein
MAAFVGIALLLPLLGVLLGIYQFAATRAPRSARTRRYDRIALVAAGVITLVAAWLGFHTAPPARGPIWPHVYAALWGFFSMLAALGGAWWRRR